GDVVGGRTAAGVVGGEDGGAGAVDGDGAGGGSVGGLLADLGEVAGGGVEREAGDGSAGLALEGVELVGGVDGAAVGRGDEEGGVVAGGGKAGLGELAGDGIEGVGVDALAVARRSAGLGADQEEMGLGGGRGEDG